MRKREKRYSEIVYFKQNLYKHNYEHLISTKLNIDNYYNAVLSAWHK